MSNNRIYFVYGGHFKHELCDTDDIWWYDLDASQGWWRGYDKPNIDSASYLTLEDLKAGYYGLYKQISKEQANEICRERYKRMLIK